jgi:hypothetical protein
VRYEGVETGAASVRISDISTTGVFIDCLASFPKGSILNLRFLVRSRELRVRGEVRHTMPQIGMGIRFVDLDPEDEELIRGLVAEKSA